MGPGLLAAVAVGLAGCSPVTQPAAIASPVGTVPLSADARLGPDSATVFTNGGAATAALVSAVASSRASIDAEIYEFNRPDLVDAMLAAMRRGVAVRMLGDPTVAATRLTGKRLAAAGAVVTSFPVGPRQIDHVKLLVVDGRVAFFGGVNWGTHSFRNQDYELRLEGPAVARLERLFATDMRRSGEPVVMPGPPQPAAPGEPRLLTSYPDDEVGRAVVAAVGEARHSIEMEMFVLTDKSTIEALRAAARRGVDVQALFDPGQDLNQAAIAALRPAGVRCRFYRTRGEKLHAKAAVLDGRLLVVGSANWTASGFRHNHELDAVLVNSVLATAVRARMDADWAAAA